MVGNSLVKAQSFLLKSNREIACTKDNKMSLLVNIKQLVMVHYWLTLFYGRHDRKYLE